MTRRERLEKQLDKRIDWAGKAEVRSERGFNSARRIADGIPFGQPILVGHHSERHARRDQARIHSGMRKGVEEAQKSEHHTSKAAGIERQLERSVFSDDEDAIEQLQARIAEREAERDRIKRYNANCRKAAKVGGKGDKSILSDSQQRDIETTARVCPYQVGAGGAFPSYALSGLSGRIKADRDRIEHIRRMADRTTAAVAAGGIQVETIGKYARVTFAEKPGREVLEELKAAGFRWGGGSWTGEARSLPDVSDAAAPIRAAAQAQEEREETERVKPQEERVCVCSIPRPRFSPGELAGLLPGQGAPPPSQYCDGCFRPMPSKASE